MTDSGRGQLTGCVCGGWYFDDERGRRAHGNAVHHEPQPDGRVHEEEG